MERQRLLEAEQRVANWQRWGPYLSERQWGTVREDYSENQDAWNHFPHDHARSRAYRWGEDGLLGICDRECRLCFSIALWNTQDTILKERLFGLSNPEGNHGEDVKECYYYLDNVPTHAYMKGLYKYPQAKFPYAQLANENRHRSREMLELELADCGVFKDERYFDCFVEYAKNSPNDLLIRITLHNRGPDSAIIHLLPQFWFRNTWAWGCTHDGCTPKPMIRSKGGLLTAQHISLGEMRFAFDQSSDGKTPIFLFTDNETNPDRHRGFPNYSKYYKDAFHRYVIDGQTQAVDVRKQGTKVAAHTIHEIPAQGEVTLRLRMAVSDEAPSEWFGPGFDGVFERRIDEANEFYAEIIPAKLDEQRRIVARQAYAGLLWTKQFYHYVVSAWLDGDDGGPALPASRKSGRNHDWRHLFNRDIISMPDKWEYPWYAAWDLAFHMIPMSQLDPEFAQAQLILFLREWYMHPNGEIPAYEWALDDVNPPVHAWACWNVYLASGQPTERDRLFLARTFQKLLMNFTWWVNRKDPLGNHIFSGGFLGLDNIGVFDRNKPLAGGGHLLQADATAWMAFYCGTMLRIALELAKTDQAYGDMASKFFEHYMAIVDATNALHGTGLWDEQDGFYYDHVRTNDQSVPLKIRSMVGLIPLCTPVILEEELLLQLPDFRKRMLWFLDNRGDLARHMTYLPRVCPAKGEQGMRLIAMPNLDRLKRVLAYMLDEEEFLSPFGIRSLSARHRHEPFVFECNGSRNVVSYVPGESNSQMFGGNSNWRGPVWFPLNYLLIESLRVYYQYYCDSLLVECPTGSGKMCNLAQVADEIEKRLISIFLPNEQGLLPCHGSDERYHNHPNWKDLPLFYEYFHGDNGRGLGASHQTGWTALVATLIEQQATGYKGQK